MDEYLQWYPGSGRFIYSHFTLYDAALDDSVPTNETIIITRHRNLDLAPYHYFDRKRVQQGFFMVDWERFAVDWELADGRAAAMMVLRGLHQEVKRRYKDWERARTARMARTANQTPAELAIAAFWRRVAQMEEERDW
ncbi:hypothetical protein UCRNP2_9957 [Neofusicoccum parvum UCRNP2]|uniref:Uncharacterized protein n=2 Tax=Neofusicoccum parvum TaxID=310453 RepID=R1E7D3_BOTPV|nr:hypothetical protein UCRNP2_9957 [Neofusicoccum parvum UCRNP2]GME22832.1 hypothetical protein NpPPO83_00000737 [Neofusicoccum parvum]